MIYSTINKFSYLELRLFIAMIASVVIVISDGKFNMCLSIRSYMDSSVYLFYCFYDRTSYMFDYVSKVLVGYKKLISENNALCKELFLKNSELLLLEQYKQENDKLHALFSSPLCNNNKRKLIAKIIFINIDSYNQQAIINQGTRSGIYIGQPVISDLGIVGQVIIVNSISSRILLISDPAHALPVKLKRNGIRMILMGRGYNSDLYAEYPGNIDICIGDMLITSGLDGRFPEGYPVGTVSSIKINAEKDFTIIRAQPTVKLQYLHYSVLIWE